MASISEIIQASKRASMSWIRSYSLVCLILILSFNLSSCVSNSEYIENGVYTTGYIYEIRNDTRGEVLLYRYYADSTLFEYDESIPHIAGLRSKIIYKNFPVIYVPENPSVPRLLLFKYDFEHLGLNYPDSLKWVEELRNPAPLSP